MMNPLLRSHLEPVWRRRQNLRLFGQLALCWTAFALLGLGLVLLQRNSGWNSWLLLAAFAGMGMIAAVVIAARHRRIAPDWRAVAREIERRHPELNGLLLTASQQHPADGQEFSYLQERLVRDAMGHHEKHDWTTAVASRRLAWVHAAHVVALGAFAMVLFALRPVPLEHRAVAQVGSGVAVTPGDVSLERGSSLVVMTRFEGEVPVGADLVLDSGSESVQRIPLVRSLADPMFGGTVPGVTNDFNYRIEYAGERTRDFRVTVFEYPRLERADAELTYPAYTKLERKRIEDTRRLSAVEGTRLDLTLQLNKAVESARLVAKGNETNALPLVVEENRAVARLKAFPLAANQTWQLQLRDADGRTNKVPAQFVINVSKNRMPELKIASPRGDIRPSALEEVRFEGTAWDDFGVEAFGLAYMIAGQDATYVELGTQVPGNEKRSFQHLLRLEDLSAQPDQLISWFVWADDIGPDGERRRTTGDLFFAEVRPFDEIFREGQGMGAQGQQQQSGEQSGQEGSPSSRLAELQKQIISATWKLKREHGNRAKESGKDIKSGDQTRNDTGTKQARTAHAPRGPRVDRMALRSGSSEQPLGWEVGRRVSPPPIRLLRRVGTTHSLPQQIGRTCRDGTLAAFLPLPRGEGRGEGEGHPLPPIAIALFHGQPTPQPPLVPEPARPRPAPVLRDRPASPRPGSGQAPSYHDDAGVVRDAQAQALEQAQAAVENQQDPRTLAQWNAAVQAMEEALARLREAADSPGALSEALAAEQAAYQALLKLQQREYEVSRRQNQSGQQQGRNSRQQQMQRQLDQLDLAQAENRYETQSQAQAPQDAERREQLQILNRLQELARRQQDVNERLQELQTALQEARTEQEREEIRRRLKRLQEEQQRMVADADELQQRMDRPENQSRLAEQREQLAQARQDMQRAAEATRQGEVSQALASGTRAQRQVQEMRDELRRQSAGEFAEDLRQMRADARELARQQEEIQRQMDDLENGRRRTLSDANERKEVLEALAEQKERLTNLVDRATQLSQQTEEAEPLVARELYDTLRRFAQDDANHVKQMRDELLERGLLTRSLYEQLKDTAERDGAKSLELTAEMLRQGYRRQAEAAEERAREGIADLRQGIERAAERVLGDDTETLRLAQQQLDQLTEQVEREMARAEGGGSSTNGQRQAGAARAASDDNQPGENGEQQRQQQAGAGEPRQGSNEQQSGREASGQSSEQAQAAGQNGQRSGNQQGSQSQASSQEAQPQDGQQSGSSQGGRQTSEARAQSGTGRNASDRPGERPGQASNAPRENRSLSDNARRGNTSRDGSRRGPQNDGRGGRGGRLDNGLDWFFGGEELTGTGPITGEDFAPWSDRLREVEEMVELPSLRHDIATARERARQMRQEFKRDLKKPDWAVVRLEIVRPLVEVRDQIADELARREPKEQLVPIDRDPVPARFSELVRRYYEELGKDR